MTLQHTLSGGNCHYQPPGSAMVAELAKVDPLPGAQVWSPACDGYGNGISNKRCLQVCRHVIGAFEHMAVKWVVFRYKVADE